MHPITLILTALAAGSALGRKGTTSSTVDEAYGTLRTLVRRRLSERPGGDLVLARHDRSPETWERPLATELIAAGTAHDADLLAAAQALMSLVDEDGFRSGKYTVHVRGAHGVQIGDHNLQHNDFGFGLSGDHSGD